MQANGHGQVLGTYLPQLRTEPLPVLGAGPLPRLTARYGAVDSDAFPSFCSFDLCFQILSSTPRLS